MTRSPAMLLALFVAALPAGAAEEPERRLDPALRLLYRSQTAEPDHQLASDRARALVERLRRPAAAAARAAKGDATVEAPSLSLLVRFEGERSRLEAAGFAVQSRLGDVWAGTLPQARLGELATLTGVRFVQAAQELGVAVPRRVMDGSAPREAPRSRHAGRARAAVEGGAKAHAAAGVLVAFVDTGVDVFHEDFRRPDGTTRIRALLDLSDPGDLDGDGDLDGVGPYGGTLHSQVDIDAALLAGTFVATDPAGHGTHGLSVAAGDDPALPAAAAGADLLVVKATRQDGSLGFLSTDVISALAFVDAKASELGLPYVVNLSLGTTFSSHDGRSLEEQALDALVGPGIPGKAAVLAAGNSSANGTARFHHISGTAYVGLTRSHLLTVPAYTPTAGPGNDRVLLDVWYEGQDRLAVTVTPPGCPAVTVAYGDFADVVTACGDVFVANMGGANPENGDTEAIVLIDDWSGTSPAAGDWEISFTGEEIGLSGVYHGWLSDDSAVGGEAPFLAADSGHQADNLYLVGKPGGAYHAITVGSFARHDLSTRYRTSWTDVDGLARVDATAVDGDASDFSSPGPTRDGRVKPELAAPGERVIGAVSRDALPALSPTSIYRFHPWFPAEPDALLVDDTADHAFGLLQGTSFAAPVVTGVVANLLGTDPGLDAIQIRNALVGSAVLDAFTGADPDERWGYGKLDETIGHLPLPGTLRIDQDELPAASVGVPYDLVLTASGGTVPYAWAVTAGSPPAGLTLAGSLLAGVPTTPGAATFTLEVSDAALPARTASREYTLNVAATPPLAIVTSSLPRARLGKAYDEPLAAEGGQPPYSWSLVGGSLPNGLALAGGRLQGTPSELGVFPFTVRVEDGALAEAFRSLKVRVGLVGAGLWESLGIIATEVSSVAVDPEAPARFYAVTQNAFDPSQNGVFASTDEGLSWRPIAVHNGLTVGSESEVSVSPVTSTVWAQKPYVGVPGVGPYRYDEGPDAWVDTAGPDGAVDFSAAGAIFALERSTLPTIGRSTDQGAGWTTLGTLCGGTYSYADRVDLSVYRADPSHLFATRSFPGPATSSGDSVACRSSDGGVSWSEVDRVPTGSGGEYFDVEVSQTNRLDVVKAVSDAAFDYALERTTDGGVGWTRTSVPRGAFYCCMRRAPSDPAVILFATTDGLSKSTDHGQTWVSLNPGGFSRLNVSSLAFDATDADRFLVGSTAGLFLTADGGATWSRRNQGLVRHGLNGMALSEKAPSELLLATTAGEPYLSRSGGEHWTPSGTAISGHGVILPAISSADADLYLIVGKVGGGLRLSEDRGLTWTDISPPVTFGSSIQAIGADPFDADKIVVAIVGGDVYRTTDRGVTWTETGGPTISAGVTAISFARDVPGLVFLAGFGDLRRSTDGGVSWPVDLALSASWTHVEPAPSDSRYVLAARSSGGSAILHFLEPGQPWQTATVNPDRPIASLAVAWDDPQKAWAGGTHPNTAGGHGGVFRTLDGGRNWARLPGPLDAFTVVGLAAHPTVAGTLFSATDVGGVFRSDDDGVTWTALDKYGTVADLVNTTVQDPTNPNLLFAGTAGYGVQVSTNKGQSWVPRVAGLGNLYVQAIAFDPADPTTLYAGTQAGVYKSTNSGTSWAATALTSGEVTDMVTDNEGTAKRVWITVAGQGVAFSDDGGASFTLFADGLASLDLSSIELEDRGAAKRVWITSRGGEGVAYSDDLGQTWTSAAGNGLTDREVHDLAIDGAAKRVWITADDGVFWSDDGQVWTELSRGLPGHAPATSVAIDPASQEVLVSLLSRDEGGVFRGGNVQGVWSPFSDGLEELLVQRLTRDDGHVVEPGTLGTTFYASTSGDGVYVRELLTPAGTVPTIATAVLPDGTLRAPYAVALAASGGEPPYVWSLTDGGLPPGLELSAASGEISGVPGLAGLFAVTIQVADAGSRRSRKDLTLRIDDPNLPFLVVDDVVVVEGDAGTVDAVFTVTLSSAAAASVGFATADATARAGEDYAAATGTLDFVPPATTQTVAVEVSGDAAAEPSESFSLLLRTPVGARIGDAQGVGTIANDDAPPPALSIGDLSVAEGDAGAQVATFTVALSATTSQEVEVGFATSAGTATAGVDFEPGAGTVTIPPGSPSQPIVVTISGDLLDEPDETFFVTLASPTNATLADAQAEGTILDDDPLPSLSIGDLSVVEGDAGTTAAIFSVTLSASTSKTVTIAVATTVGTAAAGSDYVHAATTLTFDPGVVARTVAVAVLGDVVDEPSESFFVDLSGPTNATVADSRAVGTILDDDAAAACTDAVADGGFEGGSPNGEWTEASTHFGTPLCDPASCGGAGALGGAWWAWFGGVSGSLEEGSLDQSLVLPPGSPQLRFQLYLPGGSGNGVDELRVLVDGSEVFSVLEGDAEYAAGYREVTVDLSPFAGAPRTLRFESTTTGSPGHSNFFVDEVAIVACSSLALSISDVATVEGDAGTTAAVFTVSLSGPSGNTVTVGYATANGSASAGTDYTAASGTITFPPGAVSAQRTVLVQGDLADEADETFFVNLSAPVNAEILDGQGRGTIVDDDQAGVCNEAVSDGGFEAGSPSSAWAEASTNFGTPLCDPAACGLAGARSGDGWAWFGGIAAFEQGSLEQVVVLPTGSPVLRFHLSIPSAGGNGVDFLRVRLDGVLVFSALESAVAYAAGYALVEVDLAAFADGGAHVLRFESTITGSPTSSSFFVDDVGICAPLFADGFESGSTAAWSATWPGG